jgi:putative transposase
MQPFKPLPQAQRFLSVRGMIYGHSRPRRHLMTGGATTALVRRRSDLATGNMRPIGEIEPSARLPSPRFGPPPLASVIQQRQFAILCTLCIQLFGRRNMLLLNHIATIQQHDGRAQEEGSAGEVADRQLIQMIARLDFTVPAVIDLLKARRVGPKPIRFRPSRHNAFECARPARWNLNAPARQRDPTPGDFRRASRK